MKFQGRLMQARFIKIRQVFAKINKVGCFSNRVYKVQPKENRIGSGILQWIPDRVCKPYWKSISDKHTLKYDRKIDEIIV